jgi:hypothetical protein
MTSFENLLEFCFADEWYRLRDDHKKLIASDFIDNDLDDLIEYRSNIGKGNLASYARCLAIQANK